MFHFLNTGKLHYVFSLVPTYDSIMKAEIFLVCFKNAEMKRYFVWFPPPFPWGADGNARFHIGKEF